MVTRIGGSRLKTRHKLSKSRRQKGKISINAYLQTYAEGDKVLLKAEPAIQGGMYHPRYHGKVGTVTKKQGACYLVSIQDQRATKTMLVHPIHLRRL